MLIWCRLLRGGYLDAGTSHLTKGQRLTVSAIILRYTILYCRLESDVQEGYWNAGKSTKTLYKAHPGTERSNILSEVSQVKTGQSRTLMSLSWFDVYLQIGVWFNWPKAIRLFSTAQWCQKSGTPVQTFPSKLQFNYKAQLLYSSGCTGLE